VGSREWEVGSRRGAVSSERRAASDGKIYNSISNIWLCQESQPFWDGMKLTYKLILDKILGIVSIVENKPYSIRYDDGFDSEFNRLIDIMHNHTVTIGSIHE